MIKLSIAVLALLCSVAGGHATGLTTIHETTTYSPAINPNGLTTINETLHFPGAPPPPPTGCASNGVSALGLPCPNFTPNATQARQAFNFVSSQGENTQWPGPEGYQGAGDGTGYTYAQLVADLNYINGGSGTIPCPNGGAVNTCAHGWIRGPNPTTSAAPVEFPANDTGWNGSGGFIAAATATGWRLMIPGEWQVTQASIGNNVPYNDPILAPWIMTNWFIPTLLDAASRGDLFAIEFPNEMDNWEALWYAGTDNNFASWFPSIQHIDSGSCGGFNKGSPPENWQPLIPAGQNMYGSLKANSVLKNYPVFGPSHTFSECTEAYFGQYGLAYPNSLYDVANLHSYESASNNANRSWTCASPIDNSGYGCDETFYNSHINPPWNGGGLAGLTTAQAEDIADYPRIVTESGNPSNSVTPAQQAFWIVNAMFDHWNRGFSAFANFALRDCCDFVGTTDWGIFDSSNNPKPAATALHNLNDILADNTNSFVPGQLHFTLNGCPTQNWGGADGVQSLCHAVLLQKSPTAPWMANHFLLMVNDEQNWQYTGTDNVTVNFDDPANGGSGGSYHYVIYDPQTGDHTHTIASGSGTNVVLHLVTDQQIIEVYQ